MTLVEILREKAKGYELNALAERDRGRNGCADDFAAIAVTLLELADAFEQAADIDTSDHPQAA